MTSERQAELRAIIRDRQAQSFQRRVEFSTQRKRATYNEDGTITRSGGTPERPQGNLANSGLAAGQQVSDVDGKIIGQSRASNDDVLSQLRRLEKSVTKIADTVPTRLINGDPNSQTPDLLPNYPDDLVYDLDSGTLFYWDIDASPAAAWTALQQAYQGFTGTPTATVYVEGAIAINDTNQVYTGTVSEGWTEFSGGSGEFDGVVLQGYTAGNLAADTNSSDFLKLAGGSMTERVDTNSYYDAASPNIVNIAAAGVYQISGHVRVTVEGWDASNPVVFTRWSITMQRDGGSGDIPKEFELSFTAQSISTTTSGTSFNLPFETTFVVLSATTISFNVFQSNTLDATLGIEVHNFIVQKLTAL